MKIVITGKTTVIRFMYVTILLSMTSIQFLNLIERTTTTTDSSTPSQSVDTRTAPIEQQKTTPILFEAPLIATATSSVPIKGKKVIKGMRTYIKDLETNNYYTTDNYNSPSNMTTNNNITSARNTELLSTTARKRWAYAFLMAGVNIQKPSYRGILYNILVAAEILKDSKADILVMIQMSRTVTDENENDNNNNQHRLPPNEEQWLQEMNVKIEYLDVPPAQNFYQIQFEKFRILNHTEYTRILYLDGDVMPFCVMDYLFELSDPSTPYRQPLLKENVVLSWMSEPAHGGLFLLAPQEGDYEKLQQIIDRREKEAVQGTEIFDKHTGWGHVITPPDHWHSLKGKEGTDGSIEWHFHGDFADQGLLYYWTKYYKQNVSIIFKNNVENWSSQNGEAVLEQTLYDALVPYACLSYRDALVGHYAKARFAPSWVPYRDFCHFSGRGKPWHAKRLDLERTKSWEVVKTTNSVHYWYYILRQVDRRLDMNLDFANLNIPKAIFGNYPTRNQVHEKVRAGQVTTE